MTTTISPEKMAAYRRTARRKQQEKQRIHAERRERAIAMAGKAAQVLREIYGAESVMLFGSLARGGVFDHRSDVDLAVTGLAERHYFRAVSHLLDLNPEIDVDLVRMETAPSGLAEAVRKEGVPL